MDEEMNDYYHEAEVKNEEEVAAENDSGNEEVDEEEEAEAGGGGDREEEEEEEYVFRFKNGVNPLELTENETLGFKTYQQFERLEYEALADRKRKAIAVTNA